MNRQIKFRAFSLKSKKMYYDVIYLSNYDNLPINLKGEVQNNFLNETEGLNGNFYDILNNKDFKIMQYTGLLDKNGTEIYEGDIVEFRQNFNNDKIFDSFPKDKGIVKYLDEYGCFDIKGWFGGLYLTKNSKNIEVIGNIHENPKLLGDKNESNSTNI